MRNGFFALLLLLSAATDAFGDDPAPTVPDTGDWYKISVESDGIYRITYTELRNLGIADPENVRIYGSGGAMLPETADKNFADGLKEIPVWMYTGADGVFNSGDYVLFYGQGPAVWQYDTESRNFAHSLHLWENRSYYFVTSKPGGKRIVTENAPQKPATQQVNAFDEHLFHEKESVSLVRSGRYWYGEHFYKTTGNNMLTQNFSFTIPDIDTGAPASLNISFVAKSSAVTYLEVSCNNTQIANQAFPGATGTEFSFNTPTFNPASGNISVKLTLNQNGSEYAEGWLNHIRLFARRKLNMSGSPMFFRDTRSVGNGSVSEFRITNGTANTQVWDVTNMHDIKRMSTSLSGNTLSFAAATDSLREFAAFDITSSLPKPNFPDKRIGNQNLHAINDADMVIVTHPDFMAAARQLADVHGEKDGLKVVAVTAEQVYNEFSSGMQDPAAIRNFMKLLYEKSPAGKFKYLLLMGDGSYDNKSNLMNSGQSSFNTNYIVTYQSVNSTNELSSYVSDDYFGVLGNGESVETGKLAIGIGRLPVQTAEQAQNMVDKIRRYIDAKAEGDWPNLIGLLADDEDNNLHTLQSENLAGFINTNHPQYTIDKLYFDAFPQTVTVDGHRYPEVEQRLNNLMNRGCLLINYIGHGNESALSEERVVNTTSISRRKNTLYPLFVAATCEFGRYDNYAKVTAGESMVLGPDGGAIALLTSTRLVYSNLNFQFNSGFFRELFSKPAAGDEHRLGDILKRAKNGLISGSNANNINRLCFTFLCDPALKPVIPSNSVQTVSINGIPISEPSDTLKAGAGVTVKARIADANGQTLTGFNGVAHFSLFDKPAEVTSLGNDNNPLPITFSTQNSILYKGKAGVKNGEFEISFVMPRDINYSYGFGKISYYAYSENDAAAGAFEEITVGGSATAPDDTAGPEIRLFMNDTLFRDGGITDQNPTLIAYLRDENGINTSDRGIGHGITAVLNNNTDAVYHLNPYYEAALDDSRKGTVVYRFSNLPVGHYELLFTARDINNNPSRASIRFRVTQSSVLQIVNLHNFPNPFSEATEIYFEYNMPETNMEVELQIFDMTGRELRSVKQSLYSRGYTSGRFLWDGRDATGNKMKSGIYPYRVTLRSPKGQVVRESSKIMLVY